MSIAQTITTVLGIARDISIVGFIALILATVRRKRATVIPQTEYHLPFGVLPPDDADLNNQWEQRHTKDTE